jgi:hypothetical protein
MAVGCDSRLSGRRGESEWNQSTWEVPGRDLKFDPEEKSPSAGTAHTRSGFCTDLFLDGEFATLAVGQMLQVDWEIPQD